MEFSPYNMENVSLKEFQQIHSVKKNTNAKTLKSWFTNCETEIAPNTVCPKISLFSLHITEDYRGTYCIGLLT